MMYKMRVTFDTIGYEEWPESLQFTLVPDLLVPVPSCNDMVRTKEHVMGDCHPYEPPPNYAWPSEVTNWWEIATPDHSHPADDGIVFIVLVNQFVRFKISLLFFIIISNSVIAEEIWIKFSPMLHIALCVHLGFCVD